MKPLVIPDLWEVKDMQGAGIKPAGGNATWCGLPLFGGGVTTWIDLGVQSSPTAKFLQSIKGTLAGVPVDNTKLWSWAITYDRMGQSVYDLIRANRLSQYHVRWPIVMMSSAGVNYPAQRIAVDCYSTDNKWARIEGIPLLADYSKLTLDFMVENGYGGCAYTAFSNGTYRLSSNGTLFFVPYFNYGFPYSKGFDGQLWLSTNYLGTKIGQAQVLP